MTGRLYIRPPTDNIVVAFADSKPVVSLVFVSASYNVYDIEASPCCLVDRPKRCLKRPLYSARDVKHPIGYFSKIFL